VIPSNINELYIKFTRYIKIYERKSTETGQIRVTHFLSEGD